MEKDELHSFSSELSPKELADRITRVAGQWDGEWQPRDSEGNKKRGRLGLPVTAGLRRGWLAGELEIEAEGGGSRAVLKVDKGEMKLDRASVFILLVGAFGGIVTIVAPFFPGLLALVPVGLLLGFSAWFMVVARLRSAGLEEFFAQAENEG